MCFIINKDICPKQLIAEKDIISYKVMQYTEAGEISSIIYHHTILDKSDHYKFKKLYTAKQFHPDLRKHRVIKKLEVVHGQINAGFHSYQSVDIALSNMEIGSHFIVVCVIPAGTPYYKNVEEYVSKKIIFSTKFRGQICASA